MADVLAARRKRLRFLSRRRGTKESDLILGGFADRHVDDLSAAQIDRFEALLDCNDPDLMAWVTGAEPVPPEHDHDVMDLLLDFKNALSKT